MTRLIDTKVSDLVDTMQAGQLLDNVKVTYQQAADARKYLARHGALDLADALGVGR